MQQTLVFGRDAGRKHHQHHQVPLYDSGVGASRVRDIFKQAKEKAPCSRPWFLEVVLDVSIISIIRCRCTIAAWVPRACGTS